MQVRNLYGPLLACVTASKSAFDAMCRQHSPDGTPKTFIEAIRSNPGGREGQVYRYSSCWVSLPSYVLQDPDRRPCVLGKMWVAYLKGTSTA